MLNVWNNDAFSVASLTAAINTLPVIPGRLGRLGLFQNKPVTTSTVVVEMRNGVLYLIPTRARGSQQNVPKRSGRNARAFVVPHVPLNDEVLADDVNGVRAFGSENELASLSELINERLQTMKDSHEATKEHMRAGCIQGIVLDADGTTEIYDWFEEFRVAETNIPVTLATADFKLVARQARENVEDALGSTPYNGEIRAFVGNDFWEGLITNPNVEEAFAAFQENSYARTQQDRNGFEFGGIIWENYRAKIGSYHYLPTNVARFVPMGAPGLFQEINAPGNFMEAVNTPGKPYYAKQAPIKFDIGVEMHTQTNPLMLCTQPAALVKATGS